jgi:hypothetical protein
MLLLVLTYSTNVIIIVPKLAMYFRYCNARYFYTYVQSMSASIITYWKRAVNVA